MFKKLLILGILKSLFALPINGQCPDKDSLWKRLIFLRSSTEITPGAQLKELLGYEVMMGKCSHKNDSVYAFLLQRIGVLHSYQSDYLEALKYIKQSIAISTFNTDKRLTSVRDLIRSYYNLFVIYGKLGRTTEKIRAIDSCVAVALRTGVVDKYSSYPLQEKVEYLFDVGDYQRAFSSAEMGESIIRRFIHGKDSMEYIISFLTWKVNALHNFRDFDLAEKILTDKIKDCKAIGAKEYLGNLYEQLAMILAEKGDFRKAESYFQNALQFHKDHNYDVGCEQTLTNLGYCLYFKQYKNYKKAIYTYKKALQFIDKGTKRDEKYTMEALNIFANIANAFVQQKLYDSARNYFQQAFDQIKPGANEEGILNCSLDELAQFNMIGHVANLLINKGDAYLKQFKDTRNQGYVNEALRIYKITDRLINKIKSEQSEVLSKLFWRNNIHLLYEHAIDACYLTNNLSDAFFFFEKSRAVLLNDQLNEQRWMGEVDILKNTEVKKKIVQLERDLRSTDPSASTYTELQTEVFDNKMELDRLINIIKARNPLYYQSFLDSTTITTQDVQKNLLRDHHALVEFFSGDSSIYCYVIMKQKIHLTRLDKNVFDSVVQLFNSLVSDYDLLNRRFSEFLNTSRYLNQLIFQNSVVPSGRVIISPDAYYFPVEALVTNDSQDINYFVYDHAVSYTYSARYLMNQFVTNSDVSFRNFMGMAPVHYLPNTKLAALPGSDRSLLRVKSYFTHADDFISADASKNNFLQRFSKYKIIQLYTHAVSNGPAGEPVIYFADSALYLSDLVNENKPVTRLVILTACETAKGKFFKGEGVFSFSRGFAALGVPASITNLWSVENESTYLLTELFYKYLSKGFPADIALQNAKKEFLQRVSREKQLPYFWASAVLAGKTDRIEFNKQVGWKFLFAMALVALSFWVLIKWPGAKKYKRSNKLPDRKL